MPRQDARPESLQPGRVSQWKFNTPQHYAVTRKMFECFLRDGHHISALTAPGFTDLITFLEPRYVPPGRTYLQHVC